VLASPNSSTHPVNQTACGHQPTQVIEKLLRDHAQAIAVFEQDAAVTCLEILQLPVSTAPTFELNAACGFHTVGLVLGISGSAGWLGDGEGRWRRWADRERRPDNSTAKVWQGEPR